MFAKLPIIQRLQENGIAHHGRDSKPRPGVKTGNIVLADLCADMHGSKYELLDDEEGPTVPRQTIDVRALTLGPRGHENRLGGPFWWIETEAFQLLVCGVIGANMVIITYYMTHPEDTGDQGIIEEGILYFYMLELLLRALHFKWRFVCGRTSEVIWNCLDSVIVAYGIIGPLLLTGGGENTAFMALRGFRMIRLIRVVRVFQTIISSDFFWVDTPCFQWVVGAIIALNAVFMGLETEFVENPLWWWINQMFLMFFFFEISVRLRRAGPARFFWRGDDLMWNYLDSLIVFAGALDEWIVPVLQFLLKSRSGGLSGGVGQMIMLVRILRLLRMLRLLRLVRAVRPLYHLAVGIMKALQSMFWVLVLTMVALYACALLTTHLIGKAMIPEARTIDPETRKLFGTVLDSLFTLFGLMNRQYWSDVTPIFDALPWAKPVWVLFTILSSWALLSVMTGVVSDNMLEVRQAQEQRDSDAFEEFRDRLLRVLTEVFTAADKDSSGSLEKEEYVEILTSPFHVSRLQRLANVPIQDMINMFDWIDIEGGGSIGFEDFVHGFDWLNEAVTGKSLLKLESAVRQRCCVMERSVRAVRRQIRVADELGHKQFEECKAALESATRRFDERVVKLYAQAEVADAEARRMSKAASHCWTATVASRNARERQMQQLFEDSGKDQAEVSRRSNRTSAVLQGVQAAGIAVAQSAQVSAAVRAGAERASSTVQRASEVVTSRASALSAAVRGPSRRISARQTASRVSVERSNTPATGLLAERQAGRPAKSSLRTSLPRANTPGVALKAQKDRSEDARHHETEPAEPAEPARKKPLPRSNTPGWALKGEKPP